jgi:hypothetical protein
MRGGNAADLLQCTILNQTTDSLPHRAPACGKFSIERARRMTAMLRSTGCACLHCGTGEAR